MPGLTPPQSGQREELLSFLSQQRYVLRLAVYGLDDDQVRLSPSPSSLNLGGLIKHVAGVERFWTAMISSAPLPTDDYEDGVKSYDGTSTPLGVAFRSHIEKRRH